MGRGGGRGRGVGVVSRLGSESELGLGFSSGLGLQLGGFEVQALDLGEWRLGEHGQCLCGRPSLVEPLDAAFGGKLLQRLQGQSW